MPPTDLLMLFLGLEAFTFAFYILVAIERGSATGGEAGLKYLLNGTLSAALLAMGMALVYAAAGRSSWPSWLPLAGTPEPLFLAGGCLILLGMAFKLSLVPAHLWTPDVYQGAPAPVTALLSTASKGASLAALLLLLPLFGAWRGLHDILWLAGAALHADRESGRAGADKPQTDAGLVVGRPDGLRGAGAGGSPGWRRDGRPFFMLVVYATAGVAAFGVVSVLSDEEERDAIDAYRGLGYRSPLAGAALAVALFSLAGIPPTAGFMGKFAVFAAALSGGESTLALVGILSALVAVFFYLRVVVVMYMKSSELPVETPRTLHIAEIAALLAPTAVMVGLGVYPQPLLHLLERILPF